MADEQLVRALASVADAIVTEQDARRQRAVDLAIAPDGRIEGGKVRGRLRASAVGVVDQRSVRVGTVNLETKLAEIEEAILVGSLMLGGM